MRGRRIERRLLRNASGVTGCDVREGPLLGKTTSPALPGG
jgi:hypothetical protein